MRDTKHRILRFSMERKSIKGGGEVRLVVVLAGEIIGDKAV